MHNLRCVWRTISWCTVRGAQLSKLQLVRTRFFLYPTNHKYPIPFVCVRGVQGSSCTVRSVPRRRKNLSGTLRTRLRIVKTFSVRYSLVRYSVVWCDHWSSRSLKHSMVWFGKFTAQCCAVQGRQDLCYKVPCGLAAQSYGRGWIGLYCTTTWTIATTAWARNGPDRTLNGCKE